jgi:hypothetical protein
MRALFWCKGWVTLLGCFVSLGLGRAASAAPPNGREPEPRSQARAAWREAEAADYCREVTSAAGSESALLWSPRLFSRFGLGRNGTSGDDDDLDSVGRRPVWNLQAGVDVSPVRMHTGALVEARARAECRRHGAELALEDLSAAFILDQRPPLVAQVAALRAELPGAEKLLVESSAALAGSRISLQQHTATRRRVETLRQSVMEAEFALAAVPALDSSPSSRSAREVFDELRRWEAERQELDGRLRRVEGVDVSLRGGYDEVFGVEQTLPIFGSVNLELVPGRFWQPARDRESEAAHQRRVQRRIGEVQSLLTQLASRLGRQLELAEERLEQLNASFADLESHYLELKRVETPAALEFAEHAWFELVRVKADRAFARAQVESLARQRRVLQEVLRQ